MLRKGNIMTIVYILLAILILELLIFLHELGHFTAGKLLGFRILGFSLGFGPALFKFKKGETEYSLRAFPWVVCVSLTVKMKKPWRTTRADSTLSPFGSVLLLFLPVRS